MIKPNVTSPDLSSLLYSSVVNGSFECVKLLLQAGVDPNFVSQGDTPLGIAATTGGTEIIECLLDAGADPDVPNLVGSIPTELAASHNK
ncbi:protein phosphatase 1 regulatory subunit 27-like [Durio zibethinus]|uniref:Protein phosphatase 1 regulatory subunit 27-like n=1 Tax=Durio zibethinus TaxID=66656 RepID=A0A6P6AYI3_DURZI|nr:protein phosphatase 1 regulatory subunit 27-like [Durio zibethinus]XP_022769851.1 protein phosphatase 1 regulatory subunit 27-like [Durio zibethinus]